MKGDRQDGGSCGEGEAEGRHRFPSLPISDALEKELRAFERFRVSVINRGRGGRAVATPPEGGVTRAPVMIFCVTPDRYISLPEKPLHFRKKSTPKCSLLHPN